MKYYNVGWPGSQTGIRSAAANMCAGEQGVAAYWRYKDMLYYNAGAGLGDDMLITYAQKINLDTKAFRECLESNRYVANVEQTTSAASARGVDRTPMFFINGEPFIITATYEELYFALDRAVAEAGG